MIDKQKKRAYIYMISCALLWSTAGLFIKILPWNPMVIAGVRSLLAAVIYFFYLRRLRVPLKISAHSLLCGFFLSGTFLAFVAANKMTTAANAIVLQYCAPVFVLIFSALIFKEKFKTSDIVTVLATIFGIVLFFVDELKAGYFAGNLVAILAGMFFASMFLSTSRADLHTRMNGIFQGHIMTALFALPFFHISSLEINTTNILVILWLGIFQIAIPYILYGMAISHISALACVLISAIEPLLNPVWVFFFTGELPGFFALIGGIIVVTSVVLWSLWNVKQPIKRNG